MQIRLCEPRDGNRFEIPVGTHWSIELEPNWSLIEVVGLLVRFEAICVMDGKTIRMLPLFPTTPPPSRVAIAEFLMKGSGWCAPFERTPQTALLASRMIAVIP